MGHDDWPLKEVLQRWLEDWFVLDVFLCWFSHQINSPGGQRGADFGGSVAVGVWVEWAEGGVDFRARRPLGG